MASVACHAVLPGMEGHARAEVGDTDHFPTPEWVTSLLVGRGCLKFGWLDRLNILEPACGTGAICRVLRDRYENSRIHGVEVRADLAQHLGHEDWLSVGRGQQEPDLVFFCDFHDWARYMVDFTPYAGYDLVVTNPPYGNDEPVKFFESAWPLVADGGQLAMLLRLNWLASSKRAAFHREHPADVYVVARRIAFLDNGSSPTESHAWFVWTRGEAGGRWEVLA